MPDLVLLDLMLPGMDGIDVCRQIRTESGVPIVMLTAKSDTVDVVLGLESGADDYIVKPFKSKELIARVRARLRRTDDPAPEMLQIGDVSIDVAGHSVKRNGEPVNLTPLEFDLLVALARKPRQVFTREVLLEQVWGYRHAADTRLVNVHVQRLRAKIEKDPEHPEIVVTVRGVGYKAGTGLIRGRPARVPARSASASGEGSMEGAAAAGSEAVARRHGRTRRPPARGWTLLRAAGRPGGCHATRPAAARRAAPGPAVAGRLRRRWHRSLQLRVVATTLVFSRRWWSPCSASSWSSRSPAAC